MKCCSKCGTPKLKKEFGKDKRNKDSLQSQCKECYNEYGKQWRKNNKKKTLTYSKQYRKNNKEKISIKKKQWYENNKEKIAIKGKQQRKNNKEEISIKRKQYRENNKEKIKQWKQSPAGRLSCKKTQIKRYSTLKGRLGQRMGINICNSLKRAGSSKNGCHWETIVGYTVDKLKQHLGSLFTEGMNWGNYGYGKDKWCIDHKKPIASFDYDNPSHLNFKKCWALRNLQPMWCSENFSKGAKLNWRG